VFINDHERDLHADYEDWLEDMRSRLRQAPHEPICRYRHNLTGEACPEAPPSVSRGGAEGTKATPTSNAR
jgi:hypothetical protein